MYSDTLRSQLPFSEACERNKSPILEALLVLLPRRGHILEIGSGTGQHVVWFERHFPHLSWQPSECREHLAALNERIRCEGGSNILPAIELDVHGAWPDHRFAAAFSANTAHIMSWEAVCAMFSGVAARLDVGSLFCLYGPFSENGCHTAASNEEFDRQLRERDPAMGLRDFEGLESLARSNGLMLNERLQLPANNQLLVFRRAAGG